MKKIKTITFYLLICILIPVFTACEDTADENAEIPFAPYVLSLGITSHGTTTYYVVTTDNLMTGTINAVGKGIEQNGYRDYEQGGQTIFSIGGLGVTNATAIVRDKEGYLTEKGDFAFSSTLNAFSQIDDNHMMGMEIPANPESGNLITFYTVDVYTAAITDRKTAPIAPLAQMEWPSITGLSYHAGKVYVTYFPMHPKTFDTDFTDTTYVAVFDYSEMTLEKIIKDTRTGPAGSWNAFNGIFRTETNDLYIMSNSSLSNGYAKSTKNAAFLRIPNGQTDVDDYYFDFETKTGGLKPAHIKYIGNGLLLAEVSTLNPQTPADRWGDKSLKCCIIDLNNQTVKDVVGIPVHHGGGGRRFAALVDGAYVYLPVTASDGKYIYRIDPQTGTAERGARISTTFVGGLFKLN